jgi:trans-aconitate methyltransferase
MAPPGDDATENRWDAADYDDSHAFVYEYGADLLDLLDPADGERILDLGCGTGPLTHALSDRGADAVGVDRSAEMLRAARATHPTLPFVRGDARALPFPGAFDAVFSNAMLHWVADQDAVVDGVHDALRPGGRFVAELGGHGNVETIVSAVRAALASRGHDVANPWHFPSVGEYTSRLESHGFEVRFARLFDRPTRLDGADGLASWLGMFGDELFAPLDDAAQAQVVAEVEDRLRPTLFSDGGWTADYRRLRFVAVRE